MKIRAWRVQNQENLGLEGAAGVFFGLAARRRSKFWQKSTKDGAKTPKVLPKMRQEGAKMASWAQLLKSWLDLGLNLGGFGRSWGAFWRHSGT